MIKPKVFFHLTVSFYYELSSSELNLIFMWNINVFSNQFSDMHPFHQLKGIENLFPVVFLSKKNPGCWPSYIGG